jgi:hypothetical protein
MSHTTIGDLKERFGWRYESLSINEVISIMQIREKNAYDEGFKNGLEYKQLRKSQRLMNLLVVCLPRALEEISANLWLWTQQFFRRVCRYFRG